MVITNKFLRRYIKNLFGIDVDIKILKRVKTGTKYYAGYAQEKWDYKNNKVKNIIRISSKHTKDGNLPRWLIWHEVGHILGKSSYSSVMSEYYAQMWAISYAFYRRYWNIAEELIWMIDTQWKEGSDIYVKARKKILRKLRKDYDIKV